MSLEEKSTLLLNADYTPLSYFPLSIISWKDAVSGIIVEKYNVISEYDRVIKSPNIKMQMPSVVALKKYNRIHNKVTFTRFNVFLRDKFQCQYCNENFGKENLTFDHVIPRCDGGKTSWENISTCCYKCNTKKGSSRDMIPTKKPYKPTAYELYKNGKEFLSQREDFHKDWISYLYWDSELQE